VAFGRNYGGAQTARTRIVVLVTTKFAASAVGAIMPRRDFGSADHIRAHEHAMAMARRDKRW
jgi:hypothetical protein